MIDIREQVPLAPQTTLGVGGPARFFVTVTNQEELLDAVHFAEENGAPIFVLVGGSNVVISDSGFPGLVIKMQMKGIEAHFDGDDVLVRAGAGDVWDSLVAYCVERGWSGLECLSGIPGSVGAAPVQNIGAYGVSVAPFVHHVEVFDRASKKIHILSAGDCAFAYRDSIFKHPEGSSYMITHVTFRLKKSAITHTPSYHDIQNYFSESPGLRRGFARELGMTDEVSLADLRNAIIEIRSRKGMVLLPGYETYKSAGSFFKNPVVIPDVFLRARAAVGACPDGACTPPWFWSQKDGQVKIAAACLLEASGFPKGYREGRVGISPKHALAIINCGGATAAEIVAFAEKIQQRVLNKFGISLQPEAHYIGFE